MTGDQLLGEVSQPTSNTIQNHICYDISRLVTRLFRSTPNGIDRVDFTIAQHFLTQADTDASAAIVTPRRPLIVRKDVAADVLAAVRARWREESARPDTELEYERVVDFLRGNEPRTSSRSLSKPRTGRAMRGLARLLATHGMPIERAPLPADSLYFNVSQFPLWTEAPFRWLGWRHDVRAVFYIHDLLPISFPEYFPRGEFQRHKRRLANFARYGRGAIVSTPAVAEALNAFLKDAGQAVPPIHISSLPIATVFHEAPSQAPELTGHPFFLLCSTLEPRKNHLMLLSVWRMLVESLGEGAPRLILVGKRGWKYQPILDLIRNSPVLRRHVLETNHLSTPALKRLMDHCRAVLMPTFGEGFGLPVYEALTAGAPVIASDIPAFRDIEAEGLLRLSPIDGAAWYDAIAARAAARRVTARLQRPITDTSRYFDELTAFLRTI